MKTAKLDDELRARFEAYRPMVELPASRGLGRELAAYGFPDTRYLPVLLRIWGIHPREQQTMRNAQIKSED